MKKAFISLFAAARAVSGVFFAGLVSGIFFVGVVSAQKQWEVPLLSSAGRAPLRAEFISFDTRPDAESGDRNRAEYYRPIEFKELKPGKFGAEVELPFQWQERRTFLHVEGLAMFNLYVGGEAVGFSQDSRAPSEFDITPYIGEKLDILLEAFSGDGMAMENIVGAGTKPVRTYIYSQPKIRVGDYRVTARPDSLARNGELKIDVAVANDAKSEESFAVGYDIYSPSGKLLYYNIREVKLEPGGRDTVRFDDVIQGAMQNLWSAATPSLYKTTIYIRYRGRFIEYIPFNVGFGATSFERESVMRNGKAIDIKPVRYNAASTRPATESRLKELKRSGYNTIYVDYPQPYWFYDLCDLQGLYVVDQANNNTDTGRGNPDIGGALANDPTLADVFTERALTAYKRSANHVCIIGWSLGGDCGNGYNMYRAYKLLKAEGDPRPVVYRDAGGEWNNDVVLPPAR